jgi:hypothetical protein
MIQSKEEQEMGERSELKEYVTKLVFQKYADVINQYRKEIILLRKTILDDVHRDPNYKESLDTISRHKKLIEAKVNLANAYRAELARVKVNYTDPTIREEKIREICSILVDIQIDLTRMRNGDKVSSYNTEMEYFNKHSKHAQLSKVEGMLDNVIKVRDDEIDRTVKYALTVFNMIRCKQFYNFGYFIYKDTDYIDDSIENKLSDKYSWWRSRKECEDMYEKHAKETYGEPISSIIVPPIKNMVKNKRGVSSAHEIKSIDEMDVFTGYDYDIELHESDMKVYLNYVYQKKGFFSGKSV